MRKFLTLFKDKHFKKYLSLIGLFRTKEHHEFQIVN